MVRLSSLALLCLQWACSNAMTLSDQQDKSAEGRFSDESSTQQSEEIDEPVMVGGAFLVCQIDEGEVAPSDPSRVGVGCRLENKTSGQKVVLAPQVQATLAVFDTFNVRLAEFEQKDAPLASHYNWYLGIPLDKLPGAKVELNLVAQGNDLSPVFNATITGESMRDLPVDSPSFNLNFGEGEDVHVGDILDVNNAPNTRLENQCGAQREVFNQSGKIVEVGFVVSEPNTRVGITLQNICGINGGTHTVRLKKRGGTAVVAETTLTAGTTEKIVDGFMVGTDTGEYFVEIAGGREPNEQNGDYDDFLLGGIAFVSDKVITIGDVRSIPLTPLELSEKNSSTTPVAGVPEDINAVSNLNIRVSARYAMSYKYLLLTGADIANTNCRDMNVYGAEYPESKLITDAVNRLPPGPVRLCIVGKSVENHWLNPYIRDWRKK